MPPLIFLLLALLALLALVLEAFSSCSSYFLIPFLMQYTLPFSNEEIHAWTREIPTPFYVYDQK